jgi:hypothetical protein
MVSLKYDMDTYLSIIQMPANKTDINNNGPSPTDFINNSRNYPEADYKTRQKIAGAHENYIKGLLYFLGHDESVPEYLRNQMLSWGYARDEFSDNGGFPPYPISYRSITPKRTGCTNLLVPVYLSSSHIAYGSIRMEPVFMVLGQSAAMAASMAIDNNCKVQDIDVRSLQNKLLTDPYLDGRLPISLLY